MNVEKNYKGLNSREVLESRELHGSNILTPPKKVSPFLRFLEKFSDPLIIILLIAGALSIGISCYEYWYLAQSVHVFFEPIGIFIAIFLATGLGFAFELKADKEFSILNKVNDDEPVEVIRDGKPVEIPKRDVVVGDIVILNTGNEVPADGLLLDAVSLTIDESTLTGEPISSKTVDETHFDKDATIPSNMAMRGTKVMEGHGVMKVLAVGDATENGKVYEAAQIDDSVVTPLDEQLERLGRLISRVSYVLGVIIIIGRILAFFFEVPGPVEWVRFGTYLLQSVMIAVTLIVVSVPEGLPMAVTLSLASSMRRMLKTNNLVRKLHACETMGATTVICTDKTGTLTQNRMQIADVILFGNEDLLCQNMAINSTALLDLTTNPPSVLGNPTEGALLLWLFKKNIGYQHLRESIRLVDEIPFSTERKYMVSLVKNSNNETYLFVKGAPEIVFAMCNAPFGVTSKEIEAQLLVYQNQGMRTLGFAYKKLLGDIKSLKEDLLNNLDYQGMVSISDPVRDDVPEAVKEAVGAGIKVKIVTGDTPATAREIGRQVGLWDDTIDDERNIITGVNFASLSDEELLEKVGDIKIIARARPLDKKRIVEALQKHGEVVAVTGDGTNDAPALKAAHVGLSMGAGTSVAKEASDITIIDNSFASIGRAVMWGRSLFLNLRRFILFQMTVNVTACLIVLVGAFMGTQSPLTVTQMLWVNLIMDTFAATALASLPPTVAVMRNKPRKRSDFIINPAMWRQIIGVGCIFFVLQFLLLLLFEFARIESLSDIFHPVWVPYHDLSEYEVSLFFTIFVFMQFWNMFNARAYATGRSALKLKHCGEFLLISLIIVGGQILIVQFGGDFFTVVPLTFSDWWISFLGTSFVLWIGEFLRFVNRK